MNGEGEGDLEHEHSQDEKQEQPPLRSGSRGFVQTVHWNTSMWSTLIIGMRDSPLELSVDPAVVGFR